MTRGSRQATNGSLIPWVQRFLNLVPAGGTVLDVACGSGRHGRFFHARGHPVVLLDVDITRVTDMASLDGVEIVARDLEAGRPWPLPKHAFAGVVVVNYLHRPVMPDICLLYTSPSPRD